MKRKQFQLGERNRSLTLRVASCIAAILALGNVAQAQQGPQGPMAAPPDHRVARSIGTHPESEAPPSLPPEEIIRRFAQKEDEFLAERSRHTARKSIRLQELGPDGKVTGEFLRVTETAPGSEGRLVTKTVENPQSTLQHAFLAPEDLAALDHIPAFPLTTAQLPKYEVKFIGSEQVDEIDCYIFQVKPKTLEITRGLFDGIIWVDAKYLEVVKTYGKWVTERGNAPILPQYPFALFETYRENVDGKYWFPNYSRSEDTLHLKDQDMNVRLTIKWSDFKPLAAIPPANAQPTAAPPTPAPPTKP